MPALAATILQTLADEIITGKFAPGTKLEERALAARFDVSRTPIRESLRQLGARGLIDLVPRHGGVVANISIQQLADMLDAECELEALCARLAAQRMRAVDKGRLQQVHQQTADHAKRGDHQGYLTLNKQFHDLICEGSGNETIAQVVRSLRDRLGPFRRAQSGVERRLAISHGEHEVLVSAILRSDADAAYEAMRVHNTRMSTHVLELMRASRSEPTHRERLRGSRPAA